jgi:hypothetical protein
VARCEGGETDATNTNKEGEIMAETDSKSAADTGVSQAGAQSSGVQTGSGVGATQAGAQTGVGQTDVSAAQRSGTVQAESVTDVGQGEAWLTNMKRLVAGELSQDADIRAIQTGLLTRIVHNSENFDQQLRQMSVQALQNAITQANGAVIDSADIRQRTRENARTSDGRLQIIAEAQISENPIFQDAISAAVAKALAKEKAAA